MDVDAELARFKWILLAGVIFLISLYHSYREFKYATFGETAEAAVTRVFETQEMRRRGRRRKLLAVEYTFVDESGNHLSERDDVPIEFPVPENTVAVRYLPGVADSSRLLGHTHMTSVYIALACLAWLVWSFVQLYREANEPIGRRRRR